MSSNIFCLQDTVLGPKGETDQDTVPILKELPAPFFQLQKQKMHTDITDITHQKMTAQYMEQAMNVIKSGGRRETGSEVLGRPYRGG